MLIIIAHIPLFASPRKQILARLFKSQIIFVEKVLGYLGIGWHTKENYLVGKCKVKITSLKTMTFAPSTCNLFYDPHK
jgi:hypothetical protein